MKTSIRAGGKVLAASFALASCAAPGGTSVPQTTRVAHYPQCYQSVAVLRSDAISKPDAVQRFTEIDQGEREVGAILAEYGKKTTASVQQYEVAFDHEAQRLNTTPNQLLSEAGAPPPSSRRPAPQPAKALSQNTRQMAQNYSKLNQQVSEINQEQSTIERTANDRRNNMRALGVDVSA